MQPTPDVAADDPDEILRVLPEKYHEDFLAEYRAAVEEAGRRPEAYRKLRKVLRLWRLRAIAYSDPSYEPDREAAREGRGEWIPIERLDSDRLREGS